MKENGSRRQRGAWTGGKGPPTPTPSCRGAPPRPPAQAPRRLIAGSYALPPPQDSSLGAPPSRRWLHPIGLSPNPLVLAPGVANEEGTTSSIRLSLGILPCPGTGMYVAIPAVSPNSRPPGLTPKSPLSLAGRRFGYIYIHPTFWRGMRRFQRGETAVEESQSTVWTASPLPRVPPLVPPSPPTTRLRAYSPSSVATTVSFKPPSPSSNLPASP